MDEKERGIGSFSGIEQHPEGMTGDEAIERATGLNADRRRQIAETLGWSEHFIEQSAQDVGSFALLLTAEPRDAVELVLGPAGE